MEVANYLIWTHSLRKNYSVFRKDLMISSGGILFPFTSSKQFNWLTGCVLHKMMACRVFSPREEHILMRQCIITLTTHEFPALFPWLIFMSSRNGFTFSSHEEFAVFSLWWEKGGNSARFRWFSDLRSRCDQLGLGPTFQSCLAAYAITISNRPLNAHGKNYADVSSTAQAASRFQEGDGSVRFVHQKPEAWL